jgi:hypothetical protein
VQKEIPVLVSRSMGSKFRRTMRVDEGNSLGIIRLDDPGIGGEESMWNKITLSATDLVKVCVLGLRVTTTAHNGIDGYNVYIELDDEPNDTENQIAELIHRANKKGITVDLHSIITSYKMRL